MGTQHDPIIIDLQPHIDPLTGQEIYASPLPEVATLPGSDPRPDLPAIRKGAVVADSAAADPGAGIELTGDRFSSGYGDEFTAVEAAQDAGHEVRIVNGKFVQADGAPDGGQGVELTDKRFSAMTVAEVAEVKRLVASGAANSYVASLRPASDMPEHFPRGASGMYLHTKPTKYGDELHVVIKRNASTSLYEAHLWAFTRLRGDRAERVDLGRWVGTPDHSAHQFHLYPGHGASSPILCLSTDANGGMPSLSSCVVRCAQWAVGMGDVVRGRPFPFRE